MGIYKKYVFFKRSLQVLLFFNTLFVGWGIVAGYHYFQEHDVSALEIMSVGIGTLLFGLVLPGFLLYQAELRVREARRRLDAHLAELVTLWTQSFKDYQGEVFKNPLFWGNMILLAVEEFGQEMDHPLMNVFLELSPHLRKEIHRQSKQVDQKPTGKSAHKISIS